MNHESVEKQSRGVLARWFTAPPTLATEPAQDAVETVLVVEDEPDVAESIAIVIMAARPHRVVETVRSGEEALELVRSRAYAFIVVDYRLHGMDGVTFLKEALKIDPEQRALLTSASPDRAREAAAAAGLPSHVSLLPKPFGAHDLERWVAS